MFFLALGVHANETRPCLRHADRCDAELKNVSVDYTIASGDGAFILRGSVMTEEKGFFGLYFPKGAGYIAKFTVNGKEGAGIIPTRPGASNCITDIQVQ